MLILVQEVLIVGLPTEEGRGKRALLEALLVIQERKNVLTQWQWITWDGVAVESFERWN